jgi:4-hydroxybenzoate polyprenyltransferase
MFSLVARLGKERALFISGVLHICAFLSLVLLYFYEVRSLYATLFLLAAGLLLYLEHRKSHDVDLAFFKINALLGFVVFLFVISGIYLN